MKYLNFYNSHGYGFKFLRSASCLLLPSIVQQKLNDADGNSLIVYIYAYLYFENIFKIVPTYLIYLTPLRSPVKTKDAILPFSI
jgi:hypothetical protein